MTVTKGSEREYGPAAMLLNEVWWAKSFVYPDGIDWEPIMSPSIRPSDGEQALVDIALALWTGRGSSTGGFVQCMGWLDERLQRLVLDALRWRFFGEAPAYELDHRCAVCGDKPEEHYEYELIEDMEPHEPVMAEGDSRCDYALLKRGLLGEEPELVACRRREDEHYLERLVSDHAPTSSISS